MLTAVSIIALLAAIAIALTVKLPKVPAASGGSVMALAIFTQGVMVHFAGKGSPGVRVFAALTLVLWLLHGAAYLSALRFGRFRESYWNDPIGRFAIGTWVAGTSSALTAAHVNFAELHPVLLVLSIGNAGFLIFYLFAAALAAGQIAAERLHGRLHGAILLTTVSVQSVSLLLHEVFGAREYMIYRVLVLLGVMFYIAGMALLALRYSRKGWKLTEDWLDTNCIMYGAAAITGAAALQSYVFPSGLLLGIWVFALLMLLLVEGAELVRAALRIRRSGWAKGIGVYAPVQWTRLFTLGMFYFFTSQGERIFPKGDGAAAGVLHELRGWVLNGGAWGIAALLAVEVGLWVSRMAKSKNS
ncbi:hypothetical protein QWJ34_08560 [Saccharibacillus sp. CPCC 101409]|uniref:hypothetical protein n=1 Tax=Saccharibacillus sp. CPCC 101409 TaxID=3058041 RepID=UPI0026713F9E|nr:hypothetical protein [Saccharibacillus sp. CPCC 101409]MDO3409813.1 hypothetical protein [Saccharibacillus sp. CPCC 101409]